MNSGGKESRWEQEGRETGRYISNADYDKVRDIVKGLQNENTLLKKKLASQKYEIRAMKKEQVEYKKICTQFKAMDPSSLNLNIKVTTLQTDINRLTALLAKSDKLKSIGTALGVKDGLNYMPSKKEPKLKSRNLSKTRQSSKNRSLSKNCRGPRDSSKNFLRICCNEEESKKHEVQTCDKKICWKELKDWVPGEAKKLALLFKRKFMPKVFFLLIFLF
jgi:hypothetical protein